MFFLFLLILVYVLFLRYLYSSVAFSIWLLRLFRARFVRDTDDAPTQAGPTPALDANIQQRATAESLPDGSQEAAPAFDAESATRDQPVTAQPFIPRGPHLTDRQIAIFGWFRTIVASYLTGTILIQLWTILSTVSLPWIAYMLQQGMAAVMVFFLAVMFRARLNSAGSPLYDPAGYIGAPTQRLLDPDEATPVRGYLYLTPMCCIC
jgi:hypothetical protein